MCHGNHSPKSRTSPSPHQTNRVGSDSRCQVLVGDLVSIGTRAKRRRSSVYHCSTGAGTKHSCAMTSGVPHTELIAGVERAAAGVKLDVIDTELALVFDIVNDPNDFFSIYNFYITIYFFF